MSKRLLSIMLAMLMLFSLLPMSAMAIGDEETGNQSVERGSDSTVRSNPIGGSGTFWSYDEETTTLTISGEGMVPGGTDLGADTHPWDQYENDITKLVIEDGITGTQGSKAFAGLKALTEITFGENFTTVGGGAFANCSALKTVTLPETVNTLSSVAFSNCNALESLYVLNQNIAVAENATWSTNQHLPDNLTVYGYQYKDNSNGETTALYNFIQRENEKLRSEEYTGNTIGFIAYDDPQNATGPVCEGITWQYTDATKTLTISGSGDVHFDRQEDGTGTPWLGCRDVIEKVVFEEGITGVSTMKAFAEMPQLSEIVFCDTLNSLGTGVFASNQSLENVTLPETLEQLGLVVFSNCQNLKSLTVENPAMKVSASVWSSDAVPSRGAADGLVVYCNKWIDKENSQTTDFYKYVQYNNEYTKSNIIFVALDEQEPVAEGSSIRWSYDEATKTLTITGEGDLAIENYQSEPWWNIRDSVETVIFGEGITGSTGTKTFAEMDKLSEVIFPSTFEKLGTGTFASDPSLEHITLPESLESIGTVVFSNCRNLKTIVIKNRTMEAPTTGKWSSDTVSPNVPQNLTVYGYQWTDDTKHTETDFYQYVTWQNGQNDGNITFIALDDPNATAGVIGDSETFWSYDEETTTLTISGEGMVPGGTDLGADTHPWDQYENDITQLVIEDGITGTQGSKAFAGLKALTEIAFGQDFEIIGTGTFANCYALKEVTLPETVKILYAVAFSNCNALEKLYVQNRDIDVRCVVDGEMVELDEEDTGNYWSTNRVMPEDLTVYGYKYTETDGTTETEIFTYINAYQGDIEFLDLEGYAGEIGNLTWTFDDQTGTLTISGEGEIPDYTGDTQAPWAQFNGQIKNIVVEKGVTAIGANAFSGVTDLTSAKIDRTVEKIDDSAFNTEDSFTIEAKRGSAALKYAQEHQDKVTLKEDVTANILFIGNSYTEDAREYLRYVFEQYDFGADVNLGHLYSGGKTVAYYANCARNETSNSYDYGEGDFDTESPRAQEDNSASGQYSLTYLKSTGDDVAFTSQGVKTIEDAMEDMDWDIVIIQGHDVEQMYEGEYHEAFVANLNYLTNYIKSFDPSVEIGYYMTWQRNQEIGTGRINGYWQMMQKVVEKNDNVSFVIPVGTAVENARTTFLGELKYESTGSNFTKVNLLTGENMSGTMGNDNNSGLQRDNTHMSAVVGRFLAGYTIGEYLINHINSMNGTDFTSTEEITEIYSFDTDIGKLPAMYVDAIKASADAAIKEPYTVTTLTGYDDPMESIKAAISTDAYSFEGIASNDALKEAIESKLGNLNLLSGTDTTVTVSAMADGTFKATVNVQFGYLFDTVEITGIYTEEVETPEHNITVNEPNHGSVTVVESASTGETVTITVDPDNGYRLADLTVKDSSGTELELEYIGNGKYTFVMPEGAVTVDADFTRITNVKPPVDEPDEPEEPEKDELPFVDVEGGDWFYDSVYYVYANGLMDGVENNRFAPNTATNRAMLATILYRLAGQPDVSGEMPFTDVAAGTWYTDAVLWAAQNGIVNGLGENTFAPMNTLTREQLVTMLYRYAEAEGYDVSAAADLSGYPDADKVQTYAQEAMSWAVAEGIVAGMDDGTLNPAGNATRAQIATILMRFCEGVVK